MGVIQRALIVVAMIVAGLIIGVVVALLLDFIGRLGE